MLTHRSLANASMLCTHTETYLLKLTSFEPGAIRFIPATDGHRESVERRSEILEIRNAEIPPTPAFFLTDFIIVSARDGAETMVESHIELTIAVPGERDTPYDQIEDAAAHLLPCLLRQLADLIQNDLDRADSERSVQD